MLSVNLVELYNKWTEEVHLGKIFPQSKHEVFDIFLSYREKYGGHLSDDDEKYLIDLLSDREGKWFVPHLLRVIDVFSKGLMVALVETAILIPDPSYNNNFLSPCTRVFDLDVNQYLLNRYRVGDKKVKIGILRAFYWVRDRRVEITYPDKRKEIRGVKYKWNGKGFTTTESVGLVELEDVKMDEVEFKDYSQKADEAQVARIKLLLNDFVNEHELEMKYRISLVLPSKVENYPTLLQDRAKLFLKEKSRLPENMSDLLLLERIENPILRSIAKLYVKFRNWRLKSKGLISIKDL